MESNSLARHERQATGSKALSPMSPDRDARLCALDVGAHDGPPSRPQ
jgi:hypothetical protein